MQRATLKSGQICIAPLASGGEVDRDEVSERTAADDAPKCTTHRTAVVHGGGALISCEVPYFTDSNNIIMKEDNHLSNL